MTQPIIKFTDDFAKHFPELARAKSLAGAKEATGADGPPVITFGTTMSYMPTYNDKGSGATMDGAFYRPTAPDGWCTLGDYAQGNYNAPQQPSLTVQVTNDDPAAPVLVAPVGYVLIWNDKGSGGDMDGSIWVPVPPAGYVALGAVSQNGYDAPNPPQMRCMRLDFVKQGTTGNVIWNDQDSGADMDLSAYAIVGMSTFYAQGNYNPPLGPVWIPLGL